VLVGLSVVIGFGSGHFYAQRPEAGVVFLLTQVVGAGLDLGASVEPKPGLEAISGAALGLSRLIEVPTARVAAREVRIKWLETAPITR
jgi:hypothetical protein